MARQTERRARDPEGRMALSDHFRELRNRLAICAVALLLGTIAGWFLYEPVLAWLQRPFDEAEWTGVEPTLNFTTVGGALDLKLKVSAFIGIVLTSPIFLYQLWRFITPGLHRNERRYALGFVSASIPLFLVGAGMGYFVLLRAVPILLEFTPTGAVNYIPATVYFTFVTRLVLVFGIAFLLPVVLVALNMVGILSASTMLTGWRWVVLAIFVFTAVTVPTPDPWTMIFMALPICALYFLAVGISALNDKRRARKDGEWSDEDAAPIEGASSIGGPEQVEGPSALDELPARRGGAREERP